MLQNIVENYIKANSVLLIPIGYLSGLLVSFTPCVYPLIPVTMSIIGVHQVKSKLESFLIALTYISGISVTYTLLGIVASLTGKIFGVYTRHPIVFLLIGIIFVILGLAMLDVIYLPEISLFSTTNKPSGFLSIFFIGLISGLVVGGCTSPVLGAILLYIATTKNLFLGTLTMFSFSLGLCTLLLLLGTFSNITLPKTGKWSLWIKKFLGIIIVLFGGYLILSAIKMF